MKIEDEVLIANMADLDLVQSIGQEETKKRNLKKKQNSTFITALKDTELAPTCQSLDRFTIKQESS
jgi:hypothetical protein